MKSTWCTLLGAVALLASALVVGGCHLFDMSIAGSSGWNSPTANTQLINETMMDGEALREPPNAEEPTAADYKVLVRAYRIGPGDGISVTVPDLNALGLVYQQQGRVSATGFITLPNIGRLMAAGRTARQFEERITIILKNAKVLADPQVTVQVIDPRQETFSVIGPVARPGAYQLLRNNFTVLDALALAGDVPGGVGIDYFYVIRATEQGEQPAELISDEVEQIFAVPRGEMLPSGAFPTEPGIESVPVPGMPSVPAPSGPIEGQPVAPPLVEPAPSSVPAEPGAGVVVPLPPPAEPEGGAEGSSTVQPGGVSPGVYGQAATRFQWDAASGTFVDRGRGGAPSFQVVDGAPSDRLEEAELESALARRRVVRIDVTALKNGDPRQNIVLRPDDIVYVPPMEVGEFYIGGRAARVGVYSLTGRKLTIKMAMIAAGGPTQLSDLTRVDLTRRLDRNTESTLTINLVDINEGKVQDFYLKPNDVIVISEGPFSRPLAIFMNAFRATYGFGFVYDKNYADENQ